MERNFDNTTELIIKAKSGDNSAQTKIVENNLGLVGSIVKRFLNRGYDSEDLFQIGCIGLIKAIKKFNFDYDVKFSTYAVPMILGEIKRFIRDDGMIKVSRSLKELDCKVNITKEIMSKELGREPTLNEIAGRLGVDLEDIILAIEANCSPESLQSPIGDDEGGVFLLDRIGNTSIEIELENKIALKQVLQSLGEREREVIVLRYFKEKTQTEVAAVLGISQVHVSRIEKKILMEMRKKILGT